ncbi:MAG: sulfite exporter TauE/SafE family protein, partial [Thermoanaerobaculaceae bacterium]
GLLAFGLAYAAWGVRRALVSRKQLAVHAHDGRVHIHAHGQQSHHHQQFEQSALTFWALFIVFALGPCEPLIPLFIVPASRGLWGAALVTGLVFALVTLVTMVAAVIVVREGIVKAPRGRLANWSHAMAGSVIAISGLAVILLGL